MGIESASKNLLDIQGKKKLWSTYVNYKQPLKPKHHVSKQEYNDECNRCVGSHSPSDYAFVSNYYDKFSLLTCLERHRNDSLSSDMNSPYGDSSNKILTSIQ